MGALLVTEALAVTGTTYAMIVFANLTVCTGAYTHIAITILTIPAIIRINAKTLLDNYLPTCGAGVSTINDKREAIRARDIGVNFNVYGIGIATRNSDILRKGIVNIRISTYGSRIH